MIKTLPNPHHRPFEQSLFLLKKGKLAQGEKYPTKKRHGRRYKSLPLQHAWHGCRVSIGVGRGGISPRAQTTMRMNPPDYIPSPSSSFSVCSSTMYNSRVYFTSPIKLMAEGAGGGRTSWFLYAPRSTVLPLCIG